MPTTPRLPDHAYLRFEDLARLASTDSRPVVAVGVRDDGSLVLANQSAFGRLVTWLKAQVAGQEAQPSAQVNALLARQLMVARGGMHAIAATDRVGIQGRPLRNRDIQVVIQALRHYAPNDPAAALELRDGYESGEPPCRPSGGGDSPAAGSLRPQRSRTVQTL